MTKMELKGQDLPQLAGKIGRFFNLTVRANANGHAIYLSTIVVTQAK